jgi:hypothetical protein
MLTWTLTLLLCGPGVLRGQETPSRWQDPGSGLSLQPPAGATLVQNARMEEMLRIECRHGPVIHFSIRKSPTPVTIDAVARQAINLMQWSHAKSVVIEQRLAMISGKPGARLRFSVPDDKAPWVLVQALLLLDAHNIAVLHMDVDQHDLDAHLPVFEEIVQSIRFTDPKVLAEERKQAIARSEAVLARLTPQLVTNVLVPERWFRIIENDLDVGYMRVSQFRDMEMNQPGVRTDTQVRMVIGQQAVDTLGNSFMTDNKRTEIWSVRTTVRAKESRVRPLLGRGKQRQETLGVTPSWAETGLRSDHEITVTVQTPSGKTEHRWERPPEGYLPLGLQSLMPMLLPRDTATTYAFYSYYPNATTLVLRTERVEPRPDGSYRVFTRAAPEEPETVSEFDGRGRLVRQVLSDGRILLPSTAAQIQTIWRLR